MGEIIQFPKANKDLIKELKSLQIETINEILILADKHGVDRDTVVYAFISSIAKICGKASFKYFNVEGEADD